MERNPPEHSDTSLSEGETLDMRRESGGGAPSEAGPVPGSRLGDYELLGEIGSGGMGRVYKARQTSLDRIVALKLIHSELLDSEEYIEHLHAEARTAAKIRHPNSVGVFEVGEANGQHFIAMEFIDGTDLGELVKDAPMDPEIAALAAERVARAVAHLHEHGIVHRDLKPSNIIVDEEGEPYVTDFGVAKFFNASSDGDTDPAIVGTPSYMSPEQAAGKDRAVGPLSDVYSLGAILYELVCGRPPFVNESPIETLIQVVEKEPDLPSVHRPDLPGPLEHICLKCLDKRPQGRYPSAESMADDLRRFVAGEVVEAQPLTARKRFRRWVRRQPALASRLLPMGLFLIVEFAWYHWFRFVDWEFHRNISLLLVSWALASVGFQRWLGSERRSDAVLYCWGAADNLFLVGMLWSSENAMSALFSAYFLLIVASGFWYRVPLVMFVTSVAVATYTALAATSASWSTEELRTIDSHIIIVICMVVVGFMVGNQVRRMRRLSRHFRGLRR